MERRTFLFGALSVTTALLLPDRSKKKIFVVRAPEFVVPNARSHFSGNIEGRMVDTYIKRFDGDRASGIIVDRETKVILRFNGKHRWELEGVAAKWRRRRFPRGESVTLHVKDRSTPWIQPG